MLLFIVVINIIENTSVFLPDKKKTFIIYLFFLLRAVRKQSGVKNLLHTV